MLKWGSWMGQNYFILFYWSTEVKTDETGTCFETYEFPSNWQYPQPEAWFGAPAKLITENAVEMNFYCWIFLIEKDRNQISWSVSPFEMTKGEKLNFDSPVIQIFQYQLDSWM
jgi:hypothetical protein